MRPTDTRREDAQRIADELAAKVDTAAAAAYLRSASDDVLDGAPANPIVNRAGVDGPECLQAPAERDAGIEAALELFRWPRP